MHIVIERVAAFVVADFTVKHAENSVDIVAVNFIFEFITEPLDISVSIIANDITVNVIAVLIVADKERVPHDVFRQSVGLDFAEGVQLEDVFVHILKFLGYIYIDCKFRAKLCSLAGQKQKSPGARLTNEPPGHGWGGHTLTDTEAVVFAPKAKLAEVIHLNGLFKHRENVPLVFRILELVPAM